MSSHTTKQNTLHGYTVEDLLKLVKPDFEKGVLYWLPRLPSQFATSPNPVKQCEWWNRSFSNKPCGTVADFNGKTYVRMSLNKRSVLVAHVLLFLKVGFTLKGYVVDHKNGDSLDNRFENLRYLTVKENVRHRLNGKNKHGFIGVVKSGGRFKGRLWVDGVRKYTKSFETPEEAHTAYKELKKIFHPITTEDTKPLDENSS